MSTGLHGPDNEGVPRLPKTVTPHLRRVLRALNLSVEDFFALSPEYREMNWHIGLERLQDEFEDVNPAPEPRVRRPRPAKEPAAAGRSHEDLEYEAALAGPAATPREAEARREYARGVCYFHGEGGLPQWREEAAKCFRKAADLGDCDSQEYLGLMFFHGIGVPQDQAAAARWFRIAAGHGYLTSQLHLALLHLKGWGVPKDEPAALALIEGPPGRRIHLDPGRVYYRLGCHFDGLDVEEMDRRLAEEGSFPQEYLNQRMSRWPLAKDLFRKAADLGYAPAFYKLGQCREAAEGGYPPAQFDLGEQYRDGEGVSQDDTEAARWFLAAAEGGHRGAQHERALCHLHGRGVRRDDAQAAAWLKKAAEGDLSDRFPLDPERSGWLNSIVLLGQLYLDGRGVPRDQKAAARLFEKAAKDKYCTAAKNCLGVCYSHGIGVDQDHHKAAALFAEAAEGGNHVAMRNLALSYLRGEGVPQDWTKAFEVMKRAATVYGGYADAEYDLGCFCLEKPWETADGVQSLRTEDGSMPRSSEAEAEALMWFFKAARRGHPEAAQKVRELTAPLFAEVVE